MTTPNRRAAIYCRLATQAQGGADRLGEQEAACRQYAAAHGYTVDEAHVYREVASGRVLAERRQLSALREAIRAGQVGAVIVPSPDRLSRKLEQVAAVAEECRRAGATLAFVTGEAEVFAVRLIAGRA